jgi:hypothetical protein
VILREFIGAMKNPFGGPELLSFWISFFSLDVFWLPLRGLGHSMNITRSLRL